MLLSSVMAYRSLVEVLAGASTYLDTPPSLPRHHPISAIAQGQVTGELVCVLDPCFGGKVWSVAFSPDGLMLATGDNYGGISLWEAPSGRLLHRIKGHF